MKRILVGLLTLAAVAWLPAAGPVLVEAEDGRDFAGLYDVTDVVEVGDQMSLTLTVRVFNFSGADVAGARVLVERWPWPGDPHGEFPPMDIAYRRHAQITGSFLVPKQEYDAWPDGAPPLMVEFVDGEGRTMRRSVELIRLPLGDGGVQ